MKFGGIRGGHQLDLSPLILFPKIDSKVLSGDNVEDGAIRKKRKKAKRREEEKC